MAPLHMRRVFVAASTTYPVGGISAILYIAVACYFLISGVPPISTPGMSLVAVFVPYYTCKWALQWLGNWLVRNPMDAWRSQQTWFSYGIIMCLAMFEAIQVRNMGLLDYLCLAADNSTRQKGWRCRAAGLTLLVLLARAAAPVLFVWSLSCSMKKHPSMVVQLHLFV